MKTMGNVLKLLGLGVILLTSCQLEKRVHRKGFYVRSSIALKGKKHLQMENNKPKEQHPHLAQEKHLAMKQEGIQSDSIPVQIATDTTSAITLTQSKQPTLNQYNKKRKNSSKNHQKEPLVKNKIKSSVQKKAGTDTPEPPQKNKRKTALLIGGSLLLMTLLAGIAFPVLGTVTASIALVGIFLLDAVVAWGIYRYHKTDQPKLAQTSGILRALYTVILGVAIGYHIGGSVALFNHLWGIGLIAFGIHLITLGVLYHNEGGKKWVNYLIKGLLILAGIGYVVQYVGVLIIPNPAGFVTAMEAVFILPMVLGEVLYALWMVLKGGKQ